MYGQEELAVDPLATMEFLLTNWLVVRMTNGLI